MTRGARVGCLRCVVPGLAAAIAWGAAGAPHAAGRLPQEGRAPRAPAAAPRGDDGAAGRRDPFLPAPERTAEPAGAAAERSRGLAGLRVGEVNVVGIVATADGRLAVLEAPGGRTYVTRADDRLADGLVREVARDSVLFLLAPAAGREGAGREMRRGLGARSDGP